MRHPLWILNSALFFLLIVAFLFIVFSRPSLPEWEDITPSSVAAPLQKKASEVTISKIYEHDLFDTYEKEFGPTQEPGFVAPLPPPPPPRPLLIPEEPKPQFLEPLSINLKGIIVVLNDDTKNRAIIEDTRTRKEQVYKVGDNIEDAQLIKIFGKKVIFLRSNGQQEVLYLRPKDAQMDPVYAAASTDFADVVLEVSDYNYLVNPKEFGRRIKSLAQFIDTLDITTVYQQGKSIGCRIGLIQEKSLGQALGLRPGDIIITINSLPVIDSQNRFDIYKKISQMQTKEDIIVELIRNNSPITITYTLENFKTPKVAESAPAPAEQKVAPKQAYQEQLNILQESHKFAPTLQEIRAKERQNMLKKGKMPRNTLTSKFTE